jgi:hypothetical protein
MPSWNSVLDEINSRQTEGSRLRYQAVDLVRRNYLSELHNRTHRNVIAYYSGWLLKPEPLGLYIGDGDKSSFMTTVHELDRKLGLDLILHTPGGDIAATESIVDDLWQMFDKDIRVIVPQLAMSAGTMIACSAKSILMGKQSNLGPIDPQLRGVPAQAVLDEFDMAVASIKIDPGSTPLWQTIINKYNPTFLLECMQAIDWSRAMVKSWLQNNMFAEDSDADEKADRIVNLLSDHGETKTHARHVSITSCQEMGLKVEQLEDDNDLQDIVLTIHHAYMHTFSQTPAIKIVENHKGVATVLREGQPQG